MFSALIKQKKIALAHKTFLLSATGAADERFLESRDQRAALSLKTKYYYLVATTAASGFNAVCNYCTNTFNLNNWARAFFPPYFTS